MPHDENAMRNSEIVNRIPLHLPKTLALVEVPFIEGKIRLVVQWQNGVFLPLYEIDIPSNFALENFRIPMLMKLQLVEEDSEQ